MLDLFNTEFELKVARIIGEPISKNLPCDPRLDAIATVSSVPSGERVYEVQGIDPDVDCVIDAADNGDIILVKKTQLGTAVVTFKETESPLYYRKLGDLVNNQDPAAIARVNDMIARGMDKRELKIVLDAIVNASSTTPLQDETHKQVLRVVAESGDDLYDVIDGALREVEDYGDRLVWLNGSDAWKAIGRYRKVKAEKFNYEISLVEDMKALGAESPIKVVGKVREAGVTANGAPKTGSLPLINSNYAIFVGIAGTEKPIEFVRRRIDPDIAKLTGGSVDTMQRLVLVKNILTGDTKSTVGIYGWESYVAVINNPLSIVVVDLTAIL